MQKQICLITLAGVLGVIAQFLTIQVANAEQILFSDTFSDNDYANSPTWIESNSDDRPGTISVIDGAVQFYRNGVGGNGGIVGVYLEKELNVSNDTYVMFDGKAISRTVGDGCGWTCNEFPVNVQLSLEDSSGQQLTLRYSLNYGTAVQDQDENSFKQRALSVTQNQWVRDISFKIKDIWPTAVKIKQIFIFGSGWDFNGMIDNVRIIEKSTEASNSLALKLSFSFESSNVTGFYVGDVLNNGLNEVALPKVAEKAVVIYQYSDNQLAIFDTIFFEEIPKSILVADPDKDGRNEILIGTSNSDSGGHVYVLEFSDGKFVQEWKSPLIQSFRYGSELAVGDVNGNGNNEIIIGVSWYGRYLVSYEFDGSGYEQIFKDSIGSDVDSVHVADINKDGKDDLVVGTGCWSDYSVRFYDDYILTASLFVGGNAKVFSLDIDDDDFNEVIAAVGTKCGDDSVIPTPVAQIYKLKGSNIEKVAVSAPLRMSEAVGPNVYLAAGNIGNEKYFVVGTWDWANEHEDYIRVFSKTMEEVWYFKLHDLDDDVRHLLIEDINNDGINEIIAQTQKKFLVFSLEPSSDSCWATYENGSLHIPCIKVKSPFGELHYEADMQYQPSSEPMIFQVTGVKEK